MTSIKSRNTIIAIIVIPFIINSILILVFAAAPIMLRLMILAGEFVLLSLLLLHPRGRDFLKLEDNIYPFEEITHDAVLELVDIEGAKAIYTKFQKLLVLRDTLTSYTLRNLHSDGKITDINTGKDTTAFVTPLGNGFLQIDMIFHNPPKKNEIIERPFSCIYKDSFKNAEEYFSQNFVFPIREFKLTIKFPIGKPPRDAWVMVTDEHGVPKSNPSPLLEIFNEDKDSQGYIVYKVNKPKIHSKHTLRWIW